MGDGHCSGYLGVAEMNDCPPEAMQDTGATYIHTHMLFRLPSWHSVDGNKRLGFIVRQSERCAEAI